MPIRGEKTLHASVGMHPPNRSDFFAWILNREMLGNIEFRKSHLQAAPSPDFGAMLESFINSINNPVLINEYWKQYVESVRPIGSFKLTGEMPAGAKG